MSTAWTSQVATGCARLLAAAGVCSWDEEGIYTGDAVGAFINTMPDQPGDAIGLWANSLTPDRGHTQFRVTIRVRRDEVDPRPVQDLAQAVIDTLDHAAHLTFDQVHVPLLWLQSGDSIGPDTAGREEVSLNFYGWATYATPNLTD